MKSIKIILVLFILVLLNTTFSQKLTDQGNFSLTGSIALSYTSAKQDTKNYSILFNPTASYFVSKNLEAGLLFNFQYNENKSTGYRSIDRIWGLGPSLNVYFCNTESKPFLGISYVFSEKINDFHSKLTFNGIVFESLGGHSYAKLHSLNLSLGYLIKIHDDIALSPILQYQLSGRTFSNLGDQNTLFIGMQIKTFLF